MLVDLDWVIFDGSRKLVGRSGGRFGGKRQAFAAMCGRVQFMARVPFHLQVRLARTLLVLVVLVVLIVLVLLFRLVVVSLFFAVLVVLVVYPP